MARDPCTWVTGADLDLSGMAHYRSTWVTGAVPVQAETSSVSATV